jgi:hypothetical protein
MEKEFSKDIAEEIFLLIDSIELKLMKLKQEDKHEKECPTPLDD